MGKKKSQKNSANTNTGTVYSAVSRRTYNIVILGQSGQGKSTLINSLANYLAHETFELARQSSPIVLIPTNIKIDSHKEKFVLEVKSNVIATQHYDQNEDTTAGNAATQHTKFYTFNIPEYNAELQFFDTPGTFDGRGGEQDMKNLQSILDSIGQLKDIHAICIVMKSTKSRETIDFSASINLLLAHLHKSSVENILFCFTNTYATGFKPGETLPTLRQHLSEVKTRSGTDIRLAEDRIFCFDNTPFRFLCEEAVTEGGSTKCWRNKIPGNPEDVAKKCWKHSRAEAHRLIKSILALKAHTTEGIVCLNDIRQTLLILGKPLAEISKSQIQNKKMIEEKREQIRQYKEQGAELKEQLYLDQEVLNPVELDFPMTVCTSTKCIEYKKLRPHDPKKQIVHKYTCHDHCHLAGVQVEICPNERLKDCWAMRLVENEKVCTVCDCPWSTHMHIRYRLEVAYVRIENMVVKDVLEDTNEKLREVERFLAMISKQEDKLDRDQTELRTTVAQLTNFASENSMDRYNDNYAQYLSHQILQEEALKQKTGHSEILDVLKKSKNLYDIELQKQKAARPLTISEARDRLEKLRSMEDIGPKIVRFEEVTRNNLNNESRVVGITAPIAEVRTRSQRLKEIADREDQLAKEAKRDKEEAERRQQRSNDENLKENEERQQQLTEQERQIEADKERHSQEMQELEEKLKEAENNRILEREAREERRRHKELEKRQRQREDEERYRQEAEERLRLVEEQHRREKDQEVEQLRATIEALRLERQRQEEEERIRQQQLEDERRREAEEENRRQKDLENEQLRQRIEMMEKEAEERRVQEQEEAERQRQAEEERKQQAQLEEQRRKREESEKQKDDLLQRMKEQLEKMQQEKDQNPVYGYPGAQPLPYQPLPVYGYAGIPHPPLNPPYAMYPPPVQYARDRAHDYYPTPANRDFAPTASVYDHRERYHFDGRRPDDYAYNSDPPFHNHERGVPPRRGFTAPGDPQHGTSDHDRRPGGERYFPSHELRTRGQVAYAGDLDDRRYERATRIYHEAESPGHSRHNSEQDFIGQHPAHAPYHDPNRRREQQYHDSIRNGVTYSQAIHPTTAARRPPNVSHIGSPPVVPVAQNGATDNITANATAVPEGILVNYRPHVDEQELDGYSEFSGGHGSYPYGVVEAKVENAVSAEWQLVNGNHGQDGSYQDQN